MHELSLAVSIVEQITKAAQDAGAEKIISVRLLLGPLSGVVPESLEFCFQEACFQTIADRAELIIEKSPLKIFCFRCEKEYEVLPFELICATCGLADIKIISGKEFKIIDLEVI